MLYNLFKNEGTLRIDTCLNLEYHLEQDLEIFIMHFIHLKFQMISWFFQSDGASDGID